MEGRGRKRERGGGDRRKRESERGREVRKNREKEEEMERGKETQLIGGYIDKEMKLTFHIKTQHRIFCSFL